MQQVTQTLFWVLALLVASYPTIARRWWWAPISEEMESIPEGALTIWLFLTIVTFLLFLVASPKKRPVVLLYGIVSLATAYSVASLSVPRAATAFVLLILASVVAEAVRQNKALCAQLKLDNTRFLPLFVRTLVLWSPMILFIWFGTWLNQTWTSAVSNSVYAVTPIDRYCTVDDPELAVPFPCERMGQSLNQVDPVPFRDAQEAWVRNYFLKLKSDLLTEIDAAEVTVPNGVQQLALHNERRLTSPFLFQPPVNLRPLLAHRIAEDAEISRINLRLRTERLSQAQGNALQQQAQARAKVVAAEAAVDLLESREYKIIEFQNLLLHNLRQSYSPNLDYLGRKLVDVTNPESIAAEKEKLQFDLLLEIDKLEDSYIHTLRKLLKTIREISRAHPGKPPESEFVSEPYRSDYRRMIINYLNAQKGFYPGIDYDYFDSVVQSIFEVALDESLSYSVIQSLPQCRSTIENFDVVPKDKHEESMDYKGDPEQRPSTTSNIGTFPCPSQIPDEGLILKPIPILDSVEKSLVRYIDTQEQELDQEFREITAQAFSGAEFSKDQARDAIYKVNSDIDLGRESCYGGITPPHHCVRNYIKGRAEGAYSSAVTSLQRDALRTSSELADDAAYATEREILRLRKAAFYANNEARQEIQTAVAGWFTFGQVVSSVLLLYFGLAVIKSILYVLATEIFNEERGYPISFTEADTKQGTYEVSDLVTIPKSFVPKLLTKLQPATNQENRSTFFFQPFASVLSRIRHRIWMRLVHGGPDGGCIEFRGENGEKYANWNLEEGEQVIFPLKDFVSMSDNMRFETIISLKLSTLLLGRYVFHSVTSPVGRGHLVLKTNAVSESGRISSEILDRIVAWNTNTRFQIVAARKEKESKMRFLRDHQAIFIDGYKFGSVTNSDSSNGLFLVRASSSSRFGFGPISRFIRTFLSPF